MPAPSGTTWGSIVHNHGRIGIYTSISSTATQTTVNIQAWFWTWYSCYDGYNSLYLDVGTNVTSASTYVGSTDINHEIDTGEPWNTANQTRIYNKTFTYNRGTSAVNYNIYAKYTDIDYIGAPMYANKSFTVPALASYTISYNANGGSGAPSSQTKWYGRSLTLSSTKPTRTGYSFLGWSTSSSATSATYAAGGSYTANAAATLYAVWKANTYTVAFDANGGTGAPSNQTKTYGVTLTLSSTIPTRTNYNFLGWGTSASATTVSYAAGGNYTGNAAITLYAIWELAYIKPRITNLQIYRVYPLINTPADDGTSACVRFSWECDREISSIALVWESPTGGSGSATYTGYTGTSGEFTSYVGDGNISLESTYSFTITVTDANGYSVVFYTLSGTAYAIDFLAGGNGAAFGKPAELGGVLDISFQTRHLGGLLPVVLEPETDLNSVLTPNTYIGANISDNNYLNCPVTGGTFTLLVESCGESGQVKQTYTCCSKYMPERYSRFYYQGGWGLWCWANTDEHVLFDAGESEAPTGSVTLAASLSYYRYIEIYFTDNNDKAGGYTKVYNPDGKVICLSIIEAGTHVYTRQTVYTASGNTLTPTAATSGYVRISSNGAVTVLQGTNHIRIVRVIGRA